MARTGHRDNRSFQKYQRPDISTKLDISKASECGSSLSECVAVEKDNKGSLKRSLPVDLGGSDTSEMKKSCPTDKVNNGNSRVVFEKCTFFVSNG